MVKNTIIALLAIGVFVLVGCDTADTEKADSIEDIVGTWQRVGGSVEKTCQFSGDGTLSCSDGITGEYWFEGSQYFEKSGCPEVGVYEILLLESDNIKFEVIDDECSGRVSDLVGAFSTEGKIEWEPVP